MKFYFYQSNYKSFTMVKSRLFYFLESTDYAEIDIQVYYWDKIFNTYTTCPSVVKCYILKLKMHTTICPCI